VTKKSSIQNGSVAERVVYALPDMVFTLTRDGTYSGFLPGGGTDPLPPPEHFLGRQLEDVWGKAHADDALSRIRRVIATRCVETVEYQADSSKGIRRFEARLSPIDADEVVALVRDVTDEGPGALEQANLLTALAAALEAIELAAAYLPRDSEADIASARALSGIYQVNGLVPKGG